jgi:hypothetical protein
MRVADNESLRPSRALPPSTLPPRLEASLGQRGQTMVQVTAAPVPPTKHSSFDWERGRLLSGCPRNKRAAERGELNVHHEPDHDYRLHRL